MRFASELNRTFKLSRKFVVFNLFRPPHKCLKKIKNSPFANLTPIQALRHETSQKPLLYSTGKVCWCMCCGVLLYLKTWLKVIFFFGWGWGGVISFFLSAAACSRRLVVSVWWCNGVTVLLQWSRKASATAFRPTLASDKDTHTTPAALWAQLAHWGDMSWSQGRRTETSRISYEI